MENDDRADREFSEPSSEFGKGLTYCLGLFLAHAEGAMYDEMRFREMAHKGKGEPYKNWPEMWFYGAGDHVIDLQTEVKNSELKTRLETFKKKVLAWRFNHLHEASEATSDDVQWALKEAKALLLEIDSKMIGIETEQGGYE